MDMNKIHFAFDTIDQQVKDITRSTSMTEEEVDYFLAILAEHYSDLTAGLDYLELIKARSAAFIARMEGTWENPTVIHEDAPAPTSITVAPQNALDDAKISLHSLKCLVGNGDGDDASAADYINQIEAALSRMVALPAASETARKYLRDGWGYRQSHAFKLELAAALINAANPSTEAEATNGN